MLFLVGLTILAIVIVVRTHKMRLTRRGQAALADLRELFAGLKERAPSIEPGGASHDAAYLAAVFGVAALAVAPAYAHARRLFPAAAAGSSGSSSTSCGASSTSCGASSTSDGSSCGGGGGGGCGGCGS